MERVISVRPSDVLGTAVNMLIATRMHRVWVVDRKSCRPTGLLSIGDVLALLHPCDPRWERTTSSGPPALAPEEISAVLAWVRAGGGLLVVTEYEHNKYGDNLNALLAPVGLHVENTRVFDRSACVPGNPEWIFAVPAPGSPLGHLAARACFLRAGSCTVKDGARAAW